MKLPFCLLLIAGTAMLGCSLETPPECRTSEGTRCENNVSIGLLSTCVNGTWETVPCAGNEMCSDAHTCIEPEKCTPNSTKCADTKEGGILTRCDQNGDWSSSEPCAGNKHCQNAYSCTGSTCTPGETRCTHITSGSQKIGVISTCTQELNWSEPIMCDENAICKDDKSCGDPGCGYFNPHKDGGTYYICSSRDIDNYKSLSSNVESLVFIGKVDCSSSSCSDIPISNKLRTVRGINHAEISGGQWTSTLFSVSNANETKLETISDLSFRNIRTSANALIASAIKPLSLTHITLNDITIETNDADAGALFGQILTDNDNILIINDVTATNISVASSSSHCGGIVGGVQANAGLNISEIMIDGLTVDGLNDVGGIVGYVEGTFDISSADIKSTAIHGTEDSVGGIIGESGKLSSIVIRHTSNLFAHVEAEANTSTSGAGGIAGTLSGSVTIDDVINRCISNDCVRSNTNAAGVVGVLSNPSLLSINNVISEIESVFATQYYAAGFISQISPPTGRVDITNIISQNNIVSGNDYVSGFIQKINFNSADALFANILSSSITSLTNKNYAGFIMDLQNYDNITLDKILINSHTPILNTYHTPDNSIFNNGIPYSSSSTRLCPTTSPDYSSYRKPKSSEFRNLYNLFIPGVKNIFYVTPGWADDVNRSTLNALTTCGEEGQNDRTGKIEQCILHRDYNAPIYVCWFTDYIYQPQLTNIENLSPDSIPFKPYLPYCADYVLIDETHYEIDESTIQTGADYSNAAAVLAALNTSEDAAQSVTQWERCKSLPNASNKLAFDGVYDDLLCPVLSGTVTCMKSKNCP